MPGERGAGRPAAEVARRLLFHYISFSAILNVFIFVFYHVHYFI